MSYPPGKIRRVGSVTKAHYRKSYKQPGGKRVSKSYIPEMKRQSACIPNKAPNDQTIVQHAGKKISLRTYGYNTKKSELARRAILRKAAKNEGILAVLKHILLLSGYSADPNAKAALKDDIKFMEALYVEYKKTQHISSHKKLSSRKHSRSRKHSGSSSRRHRSRSRSRKGSRK